MISRKRGPPSSSFKRIRVSFPRSFWSFLPIGQKCATEGPPQTFLSRLEPGVTEGLFKERNSPLKVSTGRERLRQPPAERVETGLCNKKLDQGLSERPLIGRYLQIQPVFLATVSYSSQIPPRQRFFNEPHHPRGDERTLVNIAPLFNHHQFHSLYYGKQVFG